MEPPPKEDIDTLEIVKRADVWWAPKIRNMSYEDKLLKIGLPRKEGKRGNMIVTRKVKKNETLQ